MNKIFNLFSCCILVKGHRKSIIIDTQRNESYYIPNDLYNIINNNPAILTSTENKIISEYLHFLLTNELGFLLKKNENFPVINLKWESPSLITNAILEFENFKNYNIKKATDELSELGCKNILIKIYKNHDINTINRLFLCFKNKGFKSIDILISHHSLAIEEVFDFINLNPIIRNFILADSKKDELIRTSDDGMSSITLMKQNFNYPKKIEPKVFNLNLKFISESINYNNYLNRKISIDKKGYLKNTPSFKKSFGHVDNTKIKNVILNKEFNKLWSVTKDNVDTCKDCEHRYICPQLVTDKNEINLKPKVCNYDPYIGKWQ
jgi:SPASM domain peptide maturase of grasp-with-spasm system